MSLVTAIYLKSKVTSKIGWESALFPLKAECLQRDKLGLKPGQ